MANILSSATEVVKQQVADKVMQQSAAQPGQQSLYNSITLETLTQNSTIPAAEAKAATSRSLAEDPPHPARIRHRETTNSTAIIERFI